jgi:hypothetical protein
MRDGITTVWSRPPSSAAQTAIRYADEIEDELHRAKATRIRNGLAFLLVLLLLAATGCSSNKRSTVAPKSGSSAPGVEESILRPRPNKEASSRKYEISFKHPSWGDVLLTTEEIDEGFGNGPVELRVVDAQGETKLLYRNDLMHEFRPVNNTSPYRMRKAVPHSIDETGNIFLDYNPGRYNGVIVLRPVEGGLVNFGTLPPPDGYDGRFYSAHAFDLEGDGIYEIETAINDCLPSCAEGTVDFTTYTWNGSDYAPVKNS